MIIFALFKQINYYKGKIEVLIVSDIQGVPKKIVLLQ